MLQIFIFSKSAANPILVAGFFTSRKYIYSVKNKNLFAKELEIFHQEY